VTGQRLRAGLESPRAIVDYLTRLDIGSSASTAHGDPKIGGRFFYDDAMTGFNFERRKAPLVESLRELLQIVDDPQPPSIYIQALPIEESMPDFSRGDLASFRNQSARGPGRQPRHELQTHYDLTATSPAWSPVGAASLFPGQVTNLRVSPQFTLAGTPVSMGEARCASFRTLSTQFRGALTHHRLQARTATPYTFLYGGTTSRRWQASAHCW
jgi:hypothetical protein